MTHFVYTSRLLRYVLLLLFSVGLFTDVSASRRALIIGLGKQLDPAWAKINGDKDLAYMASVLRQAGYSEIDSLKNEQATKDGIIKALDRLTAQVQSGDTIFISFSGHGQLVTDVDGDEVEDGYDESWIPYDAFLKYSDNYKGEKHLVDDELYLIFKKICDKIGDGRLLVVVDACHAGDSTRGDSEEVVRGVSNEFTIPKSQIVTEYVTTKKVPWLALSACASFQCNTEISSPKVGKLTYALYTLHQKGDVSLEQIKAFMQENRGRSRYTQIPQLDGDTVMLKLNNFF